MPQDNANLNAKTRLPFQNRTEAGRLLGAELALRNLGPDPIVLALARGGVAVGEGVAEALHAPLDVIVVRKLGVPWQPELAMGAIARGTRVLDHALIAAAHISDKEVEDVAKRESEELERRERQYREGPEPDLRGRTVILVDDGLATGSSMIAATRHARAMNARRLIVAAPVGSLEACERLRREAGECVSLATPDPFRAVGEWYVDFEQVSDREVHEILKRTRNQVGIAQA
jgi:putative phosphoribosyl transferase